MQDLGVLEIDSLGNNSSQASSINNKGQIVGNSSSSQGSWRAFLWDSANGIRDLGILADRSNEFDQSFASGINNLGQVAGVVTSDSRIRGYVWDTTKTKPELVILGNEIDYDFRVTSNINDKGEIVGFTTGPRGLVWDSNGNLKQELNVLGIRKGTEFGYSIPNAINNNSQIVGISTTSASVGDTAVLWDSSGRIQDLGILLRNDNDSGDSGSNANDINNLGQVVGTFSTGDRNSVFVWENGAIANLQNLIPANSGWLLENATAINDVGEIVGYGLFNGQERAFLLTPQQKSIPEPAATLGLFALGAFGATKILRRDKSTKG